MYESDQPTPPAPPAPSPPTGEQGAAGAPVFVVVGHVNRGKSSIVSTLAADDSVRISEIPGTTRRNRAFPARASGQTLYTLIDTPGFERARATLDWLKAQSESTADRPDAVKRFVEQHADDTRFAQECELLRPILSGGLVLYVVDGSVPFSPHYEAEMEILRWTQRPRMGLINTVGRDDHTAEWRGVLDQYFNIVRAFDAHDAGFNDRIELLKALRELDESNRDSIDRAVELLGADRDHTTRDAAATIADMLAEMLTHVAEQRLPDDAEPNDYRQPLADRYYNDLRKLEQRCRRVLREQYGHNALQVNEAALAAIDDDLFDTDTWSRIGLSRSQLAAAATFSGAFAGGLIDASVGGASVMLGSAIGAGVGFGSTWFGWKHLEEVKVLGQRFAGKLLRIGPMTNPRFPWIVLDRALIYHHLVAQRAHARRASEDLGDYEESRGIVRNLAADTRNEIEKQFTSLRSRSTQNPEPHRLALTNAIFEILAGNSSDNRNNPQDHRS